MIEDIEKKKTQTLTYSRVEWSFVESPPGSLHTTYPRPSILWGGMSAQQDVRGQVLVNFICLGCGDFLKKISFGLHNTSEKV